MNPSTQIPKMSELAASVAAGYATQLSQLGYHPYYVKAASAKKLALTRGKLLMMAKTAHAILGRRAQMFVEG